MIVNNRPDGEEPDQPLGARHRGSGASRRHRLSPRPDHPRHRPGRRGGDAGRDQRQHGQDARLLPIGHSLDAGLGARARTTTACREKKSSGGWRPASIRRRSRTCSKASPAADARRPDPRRAPSAGSATTAAVEVADLGVEQDGVDALSFEIEPGELGLDRLSKRASSTRLTRAPRRRRRSRPVAGRGRASRCGAGSGRSARSRRDASSRSRADNRRPAR